MPRLCSSLLLLIASSASAGTMDWTPIGNPGNACDPQGSQGCFGAVSYSYWIGTYEVTNAQYTEFLNAIAKTDSNGVYYTAMGTFDPSQARFGGITQSGSSGSYTYSTIAGRGDMPVNYVSFPNAARFANWLQNGQPTGIQDSTTTEDGAYSITNPYFTGRNPDATVFVPTENEWYKAAYYNPTTASYFDYPAGSNTQMNCATPAASGNTANCGYVVGDLTNVGSYPGSASPYGTRDQGGNVWEWTETIATTPGLYSTRYIRGGSFSFVPIETAASSGGSFDYAGSNQVGFRLAYIPEPSTGLLVIAGLLGLARWRRGAPSPL